MATPITLVKPDSVTGADQIVDVSGLAASNALLSAGTDRSGTITTGGTAQQLAPQNANRKSLKGQNVSDTNLGINEIGGTAQIGAAGTYTVTPGSSFSISTNRAISIVGPTAGKAWTATET